MPPATPPPMRPGKLPESLAATEGEEDADFNCKTGGAPSTWPFNKKHWCCLNFHVGCPEMMPPATPPPMRPGKLPESLAATGTGVSAEVVNAKGEDDMASIA